MDKHFTLCEQIIWAGFMNPLNISKFILSCLSAVSPWILALDNDPRVVEYKGRPKAYLWNMVCIKS